MGIELARAYVRVGGDTEPLKGDLEEAKGDFSNALRDMSAGAAGILAPMSGFLTNFLSGGIAQAGRFEQTMVKMETALGSAEAAEQTLADLTEFAVKTPFEMPGILNVAQQLMGSKVAAEDLTQVMTMLADASGGTEQNFVDLGRIFAIVRNDQKLTTERMQQMTERGILNWSDFVDQGVAPSVAELRKMMSAGQISFETFEKVITRTTQKGGRNFQLAAKQSETLIGLTSTLSDGWNILARVLASTLVPPLKAITTLGIRVVDWVGELVSANASMASGMVVGAAALSTLGAALFSASFAARFFGISIRAALIGTGIGIAIVALGAGLGALIGWFSETAAGIQFVEHASAAVGEIWDNLWQAGVTIWNALAELFTAVFGVSLPTASETASQAIGGFLTFVVDTLVLVSDYVKIAADGIAYFFRNGVDMASIAIIDLTMTIAHMVGASDEQMVGFAGNFVGIWEGIKAFFGSFVTNIIGGLKEIKNFAAALWEAMKAGIDAVFSAGDPLAAMKDSFIETLAAQEDVASGGNPFEAYQDAYEAGKERVKTNLENEGGAFAALQNQKNALQQRINNREAERLREMEKKADKKEEEAKEEEAKDEEKKPEKQVEALLKAGTFGFKELGSSLQDAILKRGGEDKQAQMVSAQEKGNKIQEKILDETKKNKGLGK